MDSPQFAGSPWTKQCGQTDGALSESSWSHPALGLEQSACQARHRRVLPGTCGREGDWASKQYTHLWLCLSLFVNNVTACISSFSMDLEFQSFIYNNLPALSLLGEKKHIYIYICKLNSTVLKSNSLIFSLKTCSFPLIFFFSKWLYHSPSCSDIWWSSWVPSSPQLDIRVWFAGAVTFK